MRCAIRAVAILLLGSVAAACQESPAPRNPKVSGSVVASDSGQPLPRAKVTLVPRSRQGTPLSTTTAPDGTFSFTEVTPGSYFVGAERNGYVETRARAQEVTVGASGDVTGIRLQLTSAAVIAGKVVNEEGEPVPNANVQALRRRYGPRGPAMTPAANAQTNDLGEYRMFALAPGRYILRVLPQERWNAGVSKGPDVNQSYPPLYYPDTMVPDAAVPYEVRAGSEGRADFHLVRVEGVTVRGRVVEAMKSDQPFRGSVMLRLGREQVAGAGIEENGTFVFRGVAPGTYSLDAWGPGVTPPGGSQPVPQTAHRKIVVSSGPPDEVLLHLQPSVSGEINGYIRIEGGTPKLDHIFVNLAPVENEDDDEYPIFGRYGGGGAVKPDGSFKIQMRGRGKYRAILAARSGGLEDYYTKTVIYGGRDVTDSGFSYTGGAGTLEIVVSAFGARIEGSVVDGDGKPVPGATVVAVPEKSLRDRYDLYQPTVSDQTGHFVIRGQRPGDYTLLALEGARDAIYMDPAFLKENEDKGQTLHAEVNGRHQVSLKVIPVHDSD